jgi:hypothetical protein
VGLHNEDLCSSEDREAPGDQDKMLMTNVLDVAHLIFAFNINTSVLSIVLLAYIEIIIITGYKATMPTVTSLNLI